MINNCQSHFWFIEWPPRGCIHFFANRNVKAGTMTIQNGGDFCFNSAHRSSEPPLDAKISKRTKKTAINLTWQLAFHRFFWTINLFIVAIKSAGDLPHGTFVTTKGHYAGTFGRKSKKRNFPPHLVWMQRRSIQNTGIEIKHHQIWKAFALKTTGGWSTALSIYCRTNTMRVGFRQ